MKLTSLLNEQRVFLGLNAETSQEVMVELVDALVAGHDLPAELRDEALDALKTREEDISTGVGCGVGLPHAYLDNLSEAVAAFGRSREGIEFESCDHAPVHFVVLMLIPEDKKGQHLLTLADIGRSFLSCEVRQSLNEAATKEEILAILARS
jgi:mannitol/fructose-specific phosphotransferase system IIA component (Ntr-type)